MLHFVLVCKSSLHAKLYRALWKYQGTRLLLRSRHWEIYKIRWFRFIKTQIFFYSFAALDGYLVFSIAPHVVIRLLPHEIYLPLGISLWMIWLIAFIRYYSYLTEKHWIWTRSSITNDTYKVSDTYR